MSDYTNTMSLDCFWSLVSDIDWGSDRDYKRGKRLLMSRLNWPEAQAFGRHLDRLKGALAKAVKAWEKEHGQDCDLYGDSWGDFLSHVVGCGREVYERELADPALAFQRATSFDFAESFSYCVPYKDDYQMRDGDLLPTRACEYLEDLEEAPESAMGEVEKAHLAAIREFLETVASGYAAAAALDLGDAVKAAAEHLRPWQRHRDSGHFREAHGYAEALDHWGIPNMVSDIRQVF